MKLFYTILLMLAAFSSLSQTEALWTRYPAISPDGSKVAFSYRGDLFVVNSSGGLATQLTSHPDHDYMPIWSNDGSKIAFSSNRYGNFDVFIMSATGGQSRRLTFHSANDEPSAFSSDDAKIMFTSVRQDPASSALFPTGHLPELYSVPQKGGRVQLELGVPAEDVDFSDNGETLIYQDKKGYENRWRKHHTSSVTRDIWTYNIKSKQHTPYHHWAGEDREPLIVGEHVYFLSERNGNNFNIWHGDMSGSKPNQITLFRDHPVRFLSASKNQTLCFFYNGAIYTLQKGGEAKKINITVAADDNINTTINTPVKSQASEIAVSPNGKEIAFVVHGEVFVTSTDHLSTKRITNTPCQERNISFSPDGKKILYASERDGNWDIYESFMKDESEKYFYRSTLIEETALVTDNSETFQPAYSPDGKEIAYLKQRTGIEVMNLASKKKRLILKDAVNYSYTDGDQWFQWSPDSKWITLNFIDNNRWMGDVGLVKADGKSKVINLSESGYGEGMPTWVLNGNAILFRSDRHGRRAHASWGADADIYAVFLNQKTYDKFNLSKADFNVIYGDKKEIGKDKKGSEKSETVEEKIEPINIELGDFNDRVKRLTIHSSRLSGAVLTRDGKTLYYLSKFEKGYDLWKHDIIENTTKLMTKLNGGPASIELDKSEKNLFVANGSSMSKIDLNTSVKKPIMFKSNFEYQPYEEREYIFNHTWKQVKEKFYVKDLHGVDWTMYKEAYAQFLPHINNGIDFAEMLSEMLGELNASHTGARYANWDESGDQTGSLGLLFNYNHKGDGLFVDEVLAKGPLNKAESKIKQGTIVTHINGIEVKANDNYNKYLNGTIGQPTLLTLKDGSDTWTETLKPINRWAESSLLYYRWVKRNQEYTETYSKGKVAYIHVRGMNESSYRAVYADLLGKYNSYEAVVIDTRFNGGGWLHDDLATLLSGKKYMTFSPRGQENMGGEPIFKFQQSSIVLMGEGNYSDAHMFPYTYRALGLGKLVGMPVPGTGTAVWWERQIDGKTVFGIPQVGMKGNDGKYLENQNLIPDIKVALDPHTVIDGDDKQLKQAIDELLITGSRDH